MPGLHAPTPRGRLCGLPTVELRDHAAVDGRVRVGVRVGVGVGRVCVRTF